VLLTWTYQEDRPLLRREVLRGHPPLVRILGLPLNRVREVISRELLMGIACHRRGVREFVAAELAACFSPRRTV
jgi:hypothetical protein